MATYFFTQQPPQGPQKRQTAARASGGWDGGTQPGGLQWDQDDNSVGDSDADGPELVVTGIHADVYGACLILTVRGLFDKKLGVILMAWAWVALVIFLNLTIIMTLHNYINRDSAVAYGTRSVVEKIISRLVECLTNNIAPDKDRKLDRGLIDLCDRQPSDIFFFAVHFIWSSRMMGQLSEARTLLYSMYVCPVREIRAHTIEDSNDNIVITGLMPFDCCIFTTTLVIPKTIVAIALWYVGSQLLALTRDLSHLLLKAVSLYYISIIEHEVFQNFLAHSKKEWIVGAQMVQVHGKNFRYATSWPGEVLKLLSAVSLVFASKYLFLLESNVRTLCWQCVHNCPNACSQAFDYCFKLAEWPYNYGTPT